MLSGKGLGLLGEVELGRSGLGDAWLRSSAMAVAVGSAGASRARGVRQWCQGGVVPGKQGRRSGFGRRCDAWGGQVAAPAYGSGRRHGSGKREVEETVSGNFVIRPKFQNPVL